VADVPKTATRLTTDLKLLPTNEPLISFTASETDFHRTPIFTLFSQLSANCMSITLKSAVTLFKELIREFLNKGWGLRGLNKLLKKLLETGTMAIDEAVMLKACRNNLVFYSIIFIHKVDIIRKE